MVDTRLALQARAPRIDVSGTFNEILQNRLLQTQGQVAQEQLAGVRDDNRLRSVVNAAVRINALQTPQQKLQFARERKLSLMESGIDTSDTDAYIQALESGNVADAQQLIDQTLNVGRQLNILPAQAETFSQVRDDQGNIVAQQSDLSGRQVASPLATTPTTTVGKARQDLKKGLITQEDFDSIKSAPKEFKTDVGKLIGDKQLATDIYGADSPQVKAIQEAIDSEAKGEVADLKDEAGLRKEFTKQSTDFIKIRDAFRKIESASDTGPGDVSLIFSFMKIIDPGSTVREGEFATAEQTAGIPTRVVNLYNKALEGDRLGAEQRQGFKDEARNLFEAQKASQIQLESSFNGLAQRAGADPRDIVLDFVGDLRQQPTESIAPEVTPQDLSNLSLDELKALRDRTAQ